MEGPLNVTWNETAIARAVDGGDVTWKQAFHYERFMLGVQAVHDAASPGGTLEGVLPRPVEKGKEAPVSAFPWAAPYEVTWHSYLSSLDEDQSLLAVALSMLHITLRPMADTRTSLMSGGGPYTLLCESAFDDAPYGKCQGLWTQLFEGGFGMTASQSHWLAREAAGSCPHAPENADEVASHSTYDGKHRDTAKRVARLRELDLQYLNGSLHAVEAAVPCQVSERYRLDGAQ